MNTFKFVLKIKNIFQMILEIIYKLINLIIKLTIIIYRILTFKLFIEMCE